MAEKVTLTITVTPEKRQHIEERAQQRGYTTLEDYLLALVDSDTEEELDEEFDFDTQEGVVAGLRESLRQAIEGNTRPISELWDELEDE